MLLHSNIKALSLSLSACLGPNSNAELLTLRAFPLSVFSPYSAYHNGRTLSQHVRPNKPKTKTLLVFLFALFCICLPFCIFFIRTPELSPHTCGPINFTLKLASPLYCVAHCSLHSYFHPTIQYIGGPWNLSRQINSRNLRLGITACPWREILKDNQGQTGASLIALKSTARFQ